MIKKYLWTVCFHMLHFLYLYMLFVGKLVKQRQRELIWDSIIRAGA